jgi:hypothetical protein
MDLGRTFLSQYHRYHFALACFCIVVILHAAFIATDHQYQSFNARNMGSIQVDLRFR